MRVLFSGLYYRVHMHKNSGQGMQAMQDGRRCVVFMLLVSPGWHDRQQGRTMKETGGEGGESDWDEGRWKMMEKEHKWRQEVDGGRDS